MPFRRPKTITDDGEPGTAQLPVTLRLGYLCGLRHKSGDTRGLYHHGFAPADRPNTMQTDYDFRTIENTVQAGWRESESFRVTEDPDREKFYCLCMLPYPSGSLHMGHVRNYTIGDVISRYKRMQGFNVLQPMGWDAFGLPAENAAIKNKTAPAAWTYRNIEEMREQLQGLGIAYDWSREVATCRPDYYRWEQWFFTRLLAKGMAYRKLAVVNWDPVEQTVLANEQVDAEGRGWRSGVKVERREIPQWFLRITDYADELLNELDEMDGWPDAVKTMQRNWIGRSEGVEFDFALAGRGNVPVDVTNDGENDVIRVYTTRPDTVAGVTYMAVAAEHPVARAAALSSPEVADFIAECAAGGTSEAALETLEKRGVPLGLEAINPVTGERVPVWVANFVLMGYGTGAVMAVPAHDQRDWDFATQFGLPIRQVIKSANSESAKAGSVNSGSVSQGSATHAEGDAGASNIGDVDAGAFLSKEDTVTINSGDFDGLDYPAAYEATATHLEKVANGERKINYRLRDWGVSRQRYWGCPIPVIYDEEGNAHAVPEQDLPVVLPEDVAFSGVTSPIKSDPAFYETTVPGTDKPGTRETDTFDTFFESSWYYARYCSPDADAMLDERANYWLPVDQYIGGIEHAVMHLLYARFFHKLMRDAGLVDSDEPFTRLLTQGMVVAETFSRDDGDGKPQYFSRDELELARDDKGRISQATLHADGQPVSVGRVEKMSKSKSNGVDPLSMIDRYGADTVRLFSMSDSPPHQSLEWKEGGVEGMHRFLRRLWRAGEAFVEAVANASCNANAVGRGDAAASDAPTLDGSIFDGPIFEGLTLDGLALDDAQRGLRRKTHETISKVTDDIERRMTFNTAIASMMELFNELSRFEDDSEAGLAVRHEGFSVLLRLLAPFVPHVAHELWQRIGYSSALIDAVWPTVDETALVRDSLTLAVQVNGKRRGEIDVAADASKADCEAAARADANVQRHVDGLTIRKVIVVPGKLVNLVAT